MTKPMVFLLIKPLLVRPWSGQKIQVSVAWPNALGSILVSWWIRITTPEDTMVFMAPIKMVGMLEPPHQRVALWLCQTVCYWKWPSRNSWFSHEKWWFSIVMLNYQRVYNSYIRIHPIYMYSKMSIPKYMPHILVGGWALPLWKIWLRQLGWWHSQLNGKS